MAYKVLMFGWEFPPHNSGGLGTACFGLTRALASEGADILFVLPKKLGDVSSDRMRILFADTSSGAGTGSVEFQEVVSALTPYVNSKSYLFSDLDDEIAQSLYSNTLLGEVRNYALRARAIARRERFDIIHAHDWLSFLAGIEAKKVSGKPLILHVHATEFDRTGGQGVNSNVYDIEKYSMEYADHIIAVSNFTKDQIVRHYGIVPEKISVVHNGIDPDFRSDVAPRLHKLKEQKNKIVLFVGRITIQKGPEYFVRAAKKVLEYYPKALFIVSGSGDMERQMMTEAASLGVSDKVIFTGFLRGDDLIALYQAADLFVMPSVSEPFGITPLESIVNGTPVIVSKQSGVSEVLSHALKVDFWDTDELANKIVSVLENDSLKETLKKNGDEEVKTINWKSAAKKCATVYSMFL